jgi:CheY-like chemotaxis protein
MVSLDTPQPKCPLFLLSYRQGIVLKLCILLARTRRNGGSFSDLPGPAISSPFSLPSPMGSQRLEGAASSPLLQLGGVPRDESNRMNFAAGSGGQGSNNAHVNDAGTSGQNNLASSRLWQAAANLGLLNPQELSTTSSRPEKTFNRQEALNKLDALQKQQSSTTQILANLYGMVGKGVQNVQQATNAGSTADLPPTLNSSALSCSPHGLGEGTSASAWGSSSDSNLLPTTAPSSWPSDLSNRLAQNDLEVYTLGHLMPKSEFESSSDQSSWTFDDGTAAAPGLGNLFDASIRGKSENGGPRFASDVSMADLVAEASGSNASGSSTGQTKADHSSPGSTSQSKLRVRRTTIVPDWAIPPRVLLVDDDAVSRKLSSKFLQVFGCTIDVAVDGVGAVNKMNIEKYDLVLMVNLLFSRKLCALPFPVCGAVLI